MSFAAPLGGEMTHAGLPLGRRLAVEGPAVGAFMAGYRVWLPMQDVVMRM